MPAGPQLLLRVHANALIFAVISCADIFCAEIGAAVPGTLDNQMIQGGETGRHHPAVHSPTTVVLQDSPDASVAAKASISAASALLSKSTWRAAFQWQEFAGAGPERLPIGQFPFVPWIAAGNEALPEGISGEPDVDHNQLCIGPLMVDPDLGEIVGVRKEFPKRRIQDDRIASVPISSLEEIYEHTEALRASVKSYL